MTTLRDCDAYSHVIDRDGSEKIPVCEDLGDPYKWTSSVCVQSGDRDCSYYIDALHRLVANYLDLIRPISQSLLVTHGYRLRLRCSHQPTQKPNYEGSIGANGEP